jgi:hypothetical protein
MRRIKGLTQWNISTENINEPIELKGLKKINEGKFTLGNVNMEDSTEHILIKMNTKIQGDSEGVTATYGAHFWRHFE